MQDSTALAAQLNGHDAVISAFSGHAREDVLGYYLTGFKTIVQATRQANIARLLVVGGAGALQVAPGVLLINTPEFRAAYKATAEGARQGRCNCCARSRIWTGRCSAPA